MRASRPNIVVFNPDQWRGGGQDIYFDSDNSAVFVFSDHGDFTGDYGLVEKTRNTLEDSLAHMPLLIKPLADRAVAPGMRDQLTELIDFTATVFELAEIDPGYWHYGRSLTPLFADAAAMHRDAVFCRTATHKYVQRYYERDALYDLVADPMETRNRIDDPEARDVLLELKERMLDWYMSTCDIVPMDPDSRWLIREH